MEINNWKSGDYAHSEVDAENFHREWNIGISQALISEPQNIFQHLKCWANWLLPIRNHYPRPIEKSCFYYCRHEFIYLNSRCCSQHVWVALGTNENLQNANIFGPHEGSGGFRIIGKFWLWQLLDGINGIFSFVKK